MSEIKITKSSGEFGEQIVVSSAEFGRQALLTRFSGHRTWSVRGGYGNDMQLTVVCHDGGKEDFIKSTAMKLAHIWVQSGRDFL